MKQQEAVVQSHLFMLHVIITLTTHVLSGHYPSSMNLYSINFI